MSGLFVPTELSPSPYSIYVQLCAERPSWTMLLLVNCAADKKDYMAYPANWKRINIGKWIANEDLHFRFLFPSRAWVWSVNNTYLHKTGKVSRIVNIGWGTFKNMNHCDLITAIIEIHICFPTIGCNPGKVIDGWRLGQFKRLIQIQFRENDIILPVQEN